MKITKEMAVYFSEQCAGSYAGHMGMVPNNPALNGLMRAFDITSDGHSVNRMAFADFCESVAAVLREDGEKF